MNEQQILKEQYQLKSDYYFESERSDMLSFIPAQASTILEVGCGYGNFASLIKKKCAAQVWGVEIDSQAASIAAQKIDKVICQPFNRDLDLPFRAFDCIVFNDVLEHLVDPFNALSYCRELLRGNGVVIASIPNVRYFDNIWNLIVDKDWKYTEHGILDQTHLRFFTKKSILATFHSLHYEVESIKGINPLKEKHPHQLTKFKVLNRLFFNQIEDMQYLQFAVVARPTVS